MISGLSDRLGRKVLIMNLGLLETHHVGFVLREPVENERQALPDGIDVVGSDSHVPGDLQTRLSGIQCKDT